MLGRIAALCCIVLVLLTGVRDAQAWIENQVIGAETRIELQASGKAVVEHRVTLKTNGNERLRELAIHGVDADAEPVGQSYVIPERDALSGSLEAALPLFVEGREPPGRSPSSSEESSTDDPRHDLLVRVDTDGGLSRGSYVLVVRYQTDLLARGRLRRDGPLVEVDWTGPEWDDGLDNARVTFFVPAAPMPPRAADGPRLSRDGAAEHDHGAIQPGEAPPEGGRPEAATATRYLAEVRRGSERDEIELLRSYAPKGKALGWTILVDQRALDPLPSASGPPAPPPVRGAIIPAASSPEARPLLLGAALALLASWLLLVALKGREVRRLARDAHASVPGWLPLPLWVRALLAAVAVVAGVGLQLLFYRPIEGSAAMVLAAILSAHGTARSDASASRRGPGRWLAVTEAEGLAPPVRVRGGWLDAGTRAGRMLLVLLLGVVAAGAILLAPIAPYHAILVGLDAVVLLALFGTGRRSTLPADLAVAPIPFLRRIVRRLRRAKRAPELRVVPRIRIPVEGVDPDEVRLFVVPRQPLRGLIGIEVALTYAVGLGARVAFPELVVRLKGGTDCEQALRPLARVARVTPGRKPDEVVMTFAPRLPTTRMTTELLLALVVRLTARTVDDHRAAQTQPAPKRGSRRAAAAEATDRAAA